MVVSPDGENVYTAGGANGTITTFMRTPDTGWLTPIGVQQSGMKGLDLRQPRGMAISPDGAHVYATTNVVGGGRHFLAVAIFDRDAADGTLTHAGSVDVFENFEEVDSAWDVTISPNNRHV